MQRNKKRAYSLSNWRTLRCTRGMYCSFQRPSSVKKLFGERSTLSACWSLSSAPFSISAGGHSLQQLETVPLSVLNLHVQCAFCDREVEATAWLRSLVLLFESCEVVLRNDWTEEGSRSSASSGWSIWLIRRRTVAKKVKRQKEASRRKGNINTGFPVQHGNVPRLSMSQMYRLLHLRMLDTR